MLANQIHGQLDLIFPGLTGCFTHGLDAASLRVLIRDLADPDRIRRLGVDGVLRYVRRRGVRMKRPKAEQVVAAAQVTLRLPVTERRSPLVVLAADWALLEALDPDPRRHRRPSRIAAQDSRRSSARRSRCRHAHRQRLRRGDR
jgi:hypothetical protein